ncbi:MAP3K12-binding inhibitory protein 1 [Pleurodeles waltl]|uniref:MAP3K12-binding inhibitory protein 1 n=1 Tax=Pleurodeles waltl TaxID=8319 RepID=UPI0037093B25
MEAEAAGREMLGAALRVLDVCTRQLHLPEDVVTITINWTKLQDVPVPSPALFSQTLQQHMQSFLDKLKAFVKGEEVCPDENACRATHGGSCVKSAEPTEGNRDETPEGAFSGPEDGKDTKESLDEGSRRACLCAERKENAQGRNPEHLKESLSGCIDGNTTMKCPVENGSKPDCEHGSSKSPEVMETSKAASPGHQGRKDAFECPAEDTRIDSENSSTRSTMTASSGSTEIQEKVPSEPTDMDINMECPSGDVGKTSAVYYSAKSAGTTERKKTRINGKVHVSPSAEQDAMKCPAEDASRANVMECSIAAGGGTESEQKTPPGPSKMRHSLECLDASKRDTRDTSALSAEATIESGTAACKRVSCDLTDRDEAMECLTEDASTADISAASAKNAETTEGNTAKASEEAAADGPPGMSGAVNSSLRFDQEVVQIKAQKAEIDRRIMAFIERKQAEINKNNVREFCNVIDCNQENSCARTDAVFTPYPGFRSHVKVSRVVNTYGPQTRPDLASASSTKTSALSRDCGNQAVEERLQNIETHLCLQSGGPVPKDIYMRIKKLEEKILELEGLSPEYFQTVSFPGKRRKSQAAQSCSLVELDQKISALRGKLVRTASDLSSRHGDKFHV